MRLSIVPAAVVLILPATISFARAEEDRPVLLQAGPLKLALSPKDARIESLAVFGQEILSVPGELLLGIGDKSPVPVAKALQGLKIAAIGGGLVIEGREAESGAAFRAEWIAREDLECRVQLVAEKQPRLEALVELRLPCRRHTLRLLAPSGNDHQIVDFSRRIGLSYRGRAPQPLVMPAAVLYDPETDWGLTAMADFTLPTRGFEVWLENEQPAVVLRRVHLRLEPGKPQAVSLILAGHEGDWRPGLAKVLRRYPEFFEVADPRVPQLHGAFVCSGGTPSDQEILRWKSQHVQTVEIHGTIPFYGQHLPFGDTWTAFADDQWHVLREGDDPKKPADDAPWQAIHAYVTAKRPPNISVAKVNDYIRRLHAQGIYGILYFNPTEAWRSWITANYAQALVLDAAGKPMRAWYESYMVCPDPDTAWGKHLVDEFSKMMDLYPEADGFFMDQSCYDFLDDAHDDGWSIDQGRVGYRMGWAIGRFNERVRKVAKDRGKFIWFNGPYCTDIARFAEGMMAEAGDEDQVRAIHYLTLGGRACCTLSQQGETVFQNCAAYGLYPTAMPSSQLARLADRYWPVFEMFRGKRWVLDARALDLPAATKGNVYRLPDGNVLAVVVSAGRSVDGEAFDLDLPLAVRLPDADQFKAAYFVSPDLAGKRRLPLVRDGRKISVAVPRHRSVSALLLARTGVHFALDAPAAAVIGTESPAAVVLDNWSDRPVAVKWSGPGWKDESVLAPAGDTVRHEFLFRASEKPQSLRESSLAHAEFAGQTHGGEFEFYVDPPLAVGVRLPQDHGQDQPFALPVEVFNAAGPRQVTVRLTGEGLRIEPAEQKASLPQCAQHCFEFRAAAVRGGEVRLTARAEAGADSAEARASLSVYATKVSPLAFGRLRSGSLVFDSFGSNGGQWADKPVAVNGVRIGVVPGQGDHWERVELPISPDALKTIRELNQLRIENRPGDDFKVGRFQLHLVSQNGTRIRSSLNPGVFCQSTAWLYGEGKPFDRGVLMTDLSIAVDPACEETYKDDLGDVVSGRLMMELFGSDSGPYANKPVLLNGLAMGDLPSAGGDAWVERSMPIPPAVLETLGYSNELVIENSQPIDAFKVRGLHIRLELKGGETLTSAADASVYTSAGWEFAEGQVGSPIQSRLTFPH
ncbi:MAG: hypothetical protein HUU20_03530 [Pirellulales bacterium]|nr:hypothetical protein [Pirellulales bacterium]